MEDAEPKPEDTLYHILPLKRDHNVCSFKSSCIFHANWTSLKYYCPSKLLVFI